MGNKLSKSNIKLRGIWKERPGPLIKDETVCEMIEDPQCLICWEPICNHHARCIGCNIRLHSACEERYRKTEERNYCLCPHCKKVGTLAISSIKTITK